MKKLYLYAILVNVYLFVLTAPPAHSGFQDLIKSARQTLLGGGGLSETDIINGLKEALEIGTSNAVGAVSKLNGYYQNPQIRIPLPEKVQKIEKLMRTAGLGKQVDDFEMSMNRAAERAAPQAKSIFWNAIQQMSFDDGRKILNGGDNAATEYFRGKTDDRLKEIFKPIVHDAMSEVGVTRNYQSLVDKTRVLPFADSINLDLDQYVTGKALDGLFLVLGEEEKKIRQDPAARVTDLLKKVFGR